MRRFCIRFILLAWFSLGCACAACWPAAKPDDVPPLRVGVAVTEITPEEGQVHDPLLAKVLYFGQGRYQAALVVCDQASVSRDFTSEVRQKAWQQTGIPVGHMAITASHTHTGRSARKDAGDRIVQAIAEAKAGAKPVRLQAGTTQQQERLSFNRRYLMTDGTVRFNPGFLNPDIVRPVGPIDPQVGIVLFRDAAAGTPLASLTNFALHLDTVGKYTHFSADYPYYLDKGLKEALGGRFVSVFGTGTCGDVNHFDVSRPRAGRSAGRGQTMLTPYTPKPTDAEPSPLCAEYIGNRLAETVQAAIPNLAEDDAPWLGVASQTVHAPLATFSQMDLAWAKEAIDDRVAFLMRVRARRILDLERLRARYGDTMPSEVQAFRLSPKTAIVTLPGEVFVELGLAIKENSPFPNTLVIELANTNEPHYVPIRKAFCEGSYEVVNSRLECGAGEMLVEAAVRMLQKLKDSGPR